MTFYQDAFLGSFGGSSEFAQALADLDAKVLYKDGSRSMEGTLGLGSNLIVSTSGVEFNEELADITPASSQVSLFAREDKNLYMKDDLGAVSQLNISGVETTDISVNDTQVPVYDGTTGNFIKTTSVIIDGSDNMSGIANLTASNIIGVFDITSPIMTLDTATAQTNLTRDNSGSTYTLILPGSSPAADSLLQISNTGVGSWLLSGNFVKNPVQSSVNFNQKNITNIPIISNNAGNLAISSTGQLDLISTSTTDAMAITHTGAVGVDLSVGSLSGSVNIASGQLNVDDAISFITSGTSGLEMTVGEINMTASKAGLDSITIESTDSVGGIKLISGVSGSINLNTVLINGTGDLTLAAGMDIFLESSSDVGGGVIFQDGTSNFTTALVPGINGTSNLALTIPDVLGSPNDILTIDSEAGGKMISNFRDLGTILNNIEDLVTTATFELNHTASGADDHGIEMNYMANAQLGAEALNIEYTTGTISGGDVQAVMFTNINQSSSIGGRAASHSVVSTATGSAVIDCLNVGSNINVCRQQVGLFIDATSILVNAVDETTDLSQGGAGNVGIFSADNDTITIGLGSKFSEIEFILDTVASGAGINAIFEFSLSTIAWGFFAPIDGTNQMRQSGVVVWSQDDISSWALGVGSEYLIRITRTRNILPTTPIADLIQVSSVQEYIWNKNGKIIIDSLALLDSVTQKDISIIAPSLSANYTLTLPIDDGDASEFLQTDGSGILSWSPANNGFSTNYISGGILQFNTTSTVDILGFDCRDEDDTFDLSKATTTTLDITVVGSTGLMTGQSEAADTFYEIWAIGDTSLVNATTAFLVPLGITPVQSGYDAFRYLGAVRNNASSNFLNFYMSGKGSLRKVFYYETFATLSIGSALSGSTWTTLDASDLCPIGAGSVLLNVELETDSFAVQNIRFRPEGDSADFTDCFVLQVGEGSAGDMIKNQIEMPLATSRDIDYENGDTGRSNSVSVIGYSIEL